MCYVTFIDKKIPGTDARVADEAQLLKFDQADVTGLQIDNVHGTIIFQKKNDHWEITSPVNTPADSPTVNEVLGEIASAQPSAPSPSTVPSREQEKPQRMGPRSLRRTGSSSP